MARAGAAAGAGAPASLGAGVSSGPADSPGSLGPTEPDGAFLREREPGARSVERNCLTEYHFCQQCEDHFDTARATGYALSISKFDYILDCLYLKIRKTTGYYIETSY